VGHSGDGNGGGRPPGRVETESADGAPTLYGGLSRQRIIDAAVDFIDREGLPALTMRRLGGDLGVEAMALYRHVPGREELLDGIVETVLDRLHRDPEVHLRAEHGWQDYLQRLAHGIRRIALAHPAVFPLVATRPPDAPWIRPPLRSLHWLESFFTVLEDHGFSDDAAVVAYRAYTTFLLGHLLLEVSHQGVVLTTEDEAEAPDVDPGDVGLRKYPRLRALESRLDQDETVTEFEEGLESLLDRLSLLVDKPHKRRR
jgi:AcrR family transcriptional regulator